MIVKDGSWYQCEDRAIRRAVVCGDRRYANMFSIGGTCECCVFVDSGRSVKPKDGSGDLIREVSDPTKPIQLRVGGKYLDREGIERLLELTPARDRWVETHPFKAVGDQFTYRLDGKTIAFGMGNMPRDLICEILDTATEPELVFVAGQPYETRDGRKRIFIGENPPLQPGGACCVFTDSTGGLSSRFRNGRLNSERESHLDILRPWIDPPTEFVFNGKRYQVGPEIKE